MNQAGAISNKQGDKRVDESVTLQAPTQNDRIMAGLAHITAILPLMGIIAPIVIWATQKDKSEFVAFQALQAVVYQLTMILAWFVGMGCYMVSFFGLFLTIPFAESSAPGAPTEMLGFFMPFVIMGAIFLGGAVFVIYGIVAAIMTVQGKDFRYALIGKRLEQYMKKQ